MKIKLNLIGFLIIIVACILMQFSATLYLASGLVVIGLFLAFGFYDAQSFGDYATFENGNYIISVRVRHYYNFIPFSIVLNFIRLDLKFVYKVEHFKIVAPTKDLDDIDIPSCKITGAEYKQLLQHQKWQYENRVAPQDLVEEFCAPNDVQIKRANAKYMIPLVLCLLMLTVFTDPTPENLALVFIWGGLLAWLTIIRHWEYQEAKFKTVVYNNYLSDNTKQKA